MTRSSVDYQRRLDALRSEYVEGLPRKGKAIEAAFERLCRDGCDQQGLEAICLLVHRLAGSAGMYSVERVGRAADRLEAALRAILDGSEARADLQDRLTPLVFELERACAGSGRSSRRSASRD
jgi:hypothetical protein